MYYFNTYYPRGYYLVAMALCPCLSATSQCSIKRGERINFAFFARGLLSTSHTLWFKEIQVSTKIRVLPSVTFPETPDVENFATAYRRSYVHQLSSRKVDAGPSSVDWVDLITPPSSDARPLYNLSQRSSSSVYSSILSRAAISDSWYLFLSSFIVAKCDVRSNWPLPGRDGGRLMLRMLPGTVNYVLLAEDLWIFLATTCQTMVDVRSVSPVFTSGTHFLSISGNQHQ